MDKLLSIIMPVYNGEQYIKASIDSVLQQTYKNLELIVIDDGSTDKTPDILKEYQDMDARVKVFTQQNLGGQNARNLGLEKISGDYVAFVDADDHLCKDTYSQLIYALEKEEAQISSCWFTRIEEELLQEIEDFPSDYVVVEGREAVLKSIACDEGVAKSGGVLWNKVYSKKLLTSVKFNPDINVGEDGLFNLKLASKVNKICVCDLPLYFYRRNSNSITTTSFRSFYSWEREYLEYIKQLSMADSLYLEHYIQGMITHCCLKGAEAIVREKLGANKLSLIQQILKQYGNTHAIANNKKSLMQYRLLMFSKMLYSLFIKIKLKKKKQ